MPTVPNIRAQTFPRSLSIVVPAFNEAENLPRVIPGMAEFARANVDGGKFEVLVIDDGSSDATAEVLAQLGTEIPELRVLTHPKNRGLTAALRTGFFGAIMDYVTFLPADGQIDARELGKMFAAWDGHDLLLTTYRHRPDGALRALMSKTVRVMLKAAVGLVDRLEGAYLFRRTMLGEFDLVSHKSAGSIGLEIAAKARAHNARITSCEIECLPRLSGQSKVANFKNIAEYIGEIWRIRQSMREFKREK